MTSRFLRPLALSVSSAVLLAGAALAQAPTTVPPAPAQTPAAARTADPVLARVMGVEIRQSDLDTADEDLGPQPTQGMNPDQKRDYLLSFMIDLTIASREAERRKLQDEGEFARKLAYQRTKLLVETLLAQEARTGVTEAAMRRVYDEQIGRVPPTEEVRARHILVETEDEAKAIIAQLRGGGNFEALAKEKSKDPGGAEGGDLGFFTREQMVPEFATAAFGMNAGQTSQAPVRTQFGWHIIRVEEKRQRPAPTFDQVKGQIEEFLTRRVQGELVQRLRTGAQVERLVPQAAPAAPPSAPGGARP